MGGICAWSQNRSSNASIPIAKGFLEPADAELNSLHLHGVESGTLQL